MKNISNSAGANEFDKQCENSQGKASITVKYIGEAVCSSIFPARTHFVEPGPYFIPVPEGYLFTLDSGASYMITQVGGASPSGEITPGEKIEIILSCEIV